MTITDFKQLIINTIKGASTGSSIRTRADEHRTLLNALADNFLALIGQSVPTGGTTGQALKKNSNTDGDIIWGDISYNDLTNVPLTFTPTTHTHVAADVTDFQVTVSANTDVVANVAARHTHSNKAVLDLILDAGSGEIITVAERDKLAGLESSKFKGTYVDLASLQTAHPSPEEGSYAHVDAGAGADAELYIWDFNSSTWILQSSGTTGETPASIKTKYESNANTNAFTDADQSKLAGIEAGAEVNVQANWSEANAASDAFIQNKPSTFTPSAHTHTVSEITDYPTGTTAGEIQKWDDVGGAWVGTAGDVYVDTLSRLVAHNTSSLLQVVRTEAQLTAADFTKPILIDGEITLTSTLSFLGTGVENVTILGLGQGNSKIIAPPASTAFQISDSNVFLKEIAVEVPDGSLGIELTSISGSETLEIRDCLFSGDGNKISVQGIRQFFADVCAFFGDGYGVQVGDTLGGFSMTNCIALFKTDGVPLIQNNTGKPASFVSRLVIEKSRFELGASAPFTDLTPTSFDVADLFQLSTSRFERSGVADATDTTIFPAITKGDLPSLWLNNTGIKNTLIGGEAKVIGTSTISIAAPNTYYEVFGDLGFNSLEHFSGFVGVLANRLRNDGAYVEGVCVGSVSFTGTANDVIDLQIVKTDGVTPTVVRHIETTINNLSGSVDRAKIDFNFSMELDTNEELYMEVENKTAVRDVTVEVDSFIAFRKR